MSEPIDTVQPPAQADVMSDEQLEAVAGAGWFDEFVDAIKPAGLRIERRLI